MLPRREMRISWWTPFPRGKAHVDRKADAIITMYTSYSLLGMIRTMTYAHLRMYAISLHCGSWFNGGQTSHDGSPFLAVRHAFQKGRSTYYDVSHLFPVRLTFAEKEMSISRCTTFNHRLACVRTNTEEPLTMYIVCFSLGLSSAQGDKHITMYAVWSPSRLCSHECRWASQDVRRLIAVSLEFAHRHLNIWRCTPIGHR